VNQFATEKKIKDAFKKLARKFHPDLHPGDKEAETVSRSTPGDPLGHGPPVVPVGFHIFKLVLPS
jgi:hypothetical protein